MNSKIEVIINNKKQIAIEKIVNIHGKIGVDCDYNDIKSALNDLHKCIFNKYIVLTIFEGTYDYSNDGDDIGISLKNNVIINGVNRDKVIIKKIENNFSWKKAAVDINRSQKIKYTSIRNCTIISNNCKCPLHIDNAKMKGTFEGINLNLINEQLLGTGDNPESGFANCAAFGLRKKEQIILKNVKCNGKLWGHNYTDTKSTGSIEFYNCYSKTLQFGDLSSNGHDKITISNCRTAIFELLWFSEYKSKISDKPSLEFIFNKNKISSVRIDDHAKKYDALKEYYKGDNPLKAIS